MSDYWRVAIYKDTQLAEQPIYGSSRLGQYTGRPEPGKRIRQRKKYELSNHLGNVLAVVGDGYTTTNGDKEAWISSLQDYYPFGLAMDGRSSNLGEYRYGFNGKERYPATEWGQTSYNYGFRIYNPGIGKFLSVDPLTVEYSMLTPYQFASNRPIDGIDLDGLEFFPSSVFVWEKFEIVYSTLSGKENTQSFARPTLDYVRFKKRYPNLNFLLKNEGVFIQNNSSPPSNHTQKVIYTHDMELKSYYMAKNYKVKNGERVSTPNTVWKAHKKVLHKTSHIRQGKNPKGLIAADLALMVIEVFMESKKRAASKEARTFNNIELPAVLLTKELINNAYYSKEIPQEIIFDEKNYSELANYILRGDKSINRDINELGKWLFENSYQINNESETTTKNPLTRNDGSWKKGYSTPNPLKYE